MRFHLVQANGCDLTQLGQILFYKADSTVPLPPQYSEFAIGQYNPKGDHWENSNPHPDYKEVFTGYKNYGGTDWAYGHNRLCRPKNAGIVYSFRAPNSIQTNPNYDLYMKQQYFGPWNFNDNCVMNIWLNGILVKDRAEVPGEHKGRTLDYMPVNPELLRYEGQFDVPENTVEVDFYGGSGVLFLGYIQVGIRESQDASNEAVPEEQGSKFKGVEQCGFLADLEKFKECLAASSTKPACILFTASWPPKARKFERVFTDQALAVTEKMNFFKVDLDDQKKIKAEAAVNKAPTTVVYVDGKPKGKITSNSTQQLTNLFKDF